MLTTRILDFIIFNLHKLVISFLLIIILSYFGRESDNEIVKEISFFISGTWEQSIVNPIKNLLND